MKGNFREHGEGFIYLMPIREGSSITVTLGEIRKKNDGRFSWYRKKTEWAPDWIGEIDGKVPQGVEDIIELAKMRILEGWKNG